jgi:type IV pilus assembly protein PilW
MSIAPKVFRARPRAQGFSLVELMISMLIGLFIVGGMIYAFISSKQSFDRLETLQQMQADARLAFEYITNDARMAGHKGCFSSQVIPDDGSVDYTTVKGKFVNTIAATPTWENNFWLGVDGYNYGTNDNAVTLANVPAKASAANNWTGSDGSLPAGIFGFTQGPVPSSDILVLRPFSGEPARLTATTTADKVTFKSATVGTGSCKSTGGICANDFAMVANCQGAHVFKVSAVSATEITHVAAQNPNGASWATTYGVDAELLKVQNILYYVGVGTAGTGPSLFRQVDGGTPVELIENVESLQILYGKDTDARSATSGYGEANAYVRADELTAADWTKVVSLRVGIVIRNPKVADGGIAPDSSLVVNGVTVNFPSGSTDSKYQRRAFTSTIALRNRVSY